MILKVWCFFFQELQLLDQLELEETARGTQFLGFKVPSLVGCLASHHLHLAIHLSTHPPIPTCATGYVADPMWGMGHPEAPRLALSWGHSGPGEDRPLLIK